MKRSSIKYLSGRLEAIVSIFLTRFLILNMENYINLPIFWPNLKWIWNSYFQVWPPLYHSWSSWFGVCLLLGSLYLLTARIFTNVRWKWIWQEKGRINDRQKLKNIFWGLAFKTQLQLTPNELHILSFEVLRLVKLPLQNRNVKFKEVAIPVTFSKSQSASLFCHFLHVGWSYTGGIWCGRRQQGWWAHLGKSLGHHEDNPVSQQSF